MNEEIKLGNLYKLTHDMGMYIWCGRPPQTEEAMIYFRQNDIFLALHYSNLVCSDNIIRKHCVMLHKNRLVVVLPNKICWLFLEIEELL